MKQALEFVSLAALDALGSPENLTEAQRNARVTEWLQREITRFNTAGLRITLGGLLENGNTLMLLSEPAKGVEQRFTWTNPDGDADTNEEHLWCSMTRDERSAHVTAETQSTVQRWNAEGYHVDCMLSMEAGGNAALMFLCTKVSA
ncbi:MAG: hypothetical protein Q7R85_03715 [bacterium]|nr:hypothetical protein [bacterium]